MMMRINLTNRLIALVAVLAILLGLKTVTGNATLMDQLVHDDLFVSEPAPTQNPAQVATESAPVTPTPISVVLAPQEEMAAGALVENPMPAHPLPTLDSVHAEGTQAVVVQEAEISSGKELTVLDSDVSEMQTIESPTEIEPVHHVATTAQEGEDLPVMDLELGKGDEMVWWLVQNGYANVLVTTHVDGAAVHVLVEREANGTLQLIKPAPEAFESLVAARHLPLTGRQLSRTLREEVQRTLKQRIRGEMGTTFHYRLFWTPETDAQLSAWQRQMTKEKGAAERTRLWVERGVDGFSLEKQMLY